ncbi:MAG: DUF5063 domain-containing protein [Bacteroides sp.]|nr:DUF5063 domain-containing protein [Bacteroides sp.]
MIEDQQKLQAFVYSEEVLSFVKAANETATFLEELKEKEGKAFIAEALIHLSEVYLTMLKVGDSEPLNESTAEPSVSEQAWAEVFQRILALLGPHNEILRPAEDDEFDRSDLVTHTISEDLADVYQELRDFTSLYSRGLEEIMNDSVWEVKVRFVEHWGKKLLRSLSSLHDLYVAGVDPTEE